jgi:hypothetical protein
MSRSSTFAVVGAAILLAALALFVIPGGADEPSDSPPRAADAQSDQGGEKAARGTPRVRNDDLPLHHAIVTNKEDSAEAEIIAALDKPTTVDFQEMGLEDALMFLKSYHEINIWIDRGTLAEEGVALDQPVTLKLAGVKLESILNLLLEPNELDWVVQDEVLKITTKSWAAAHPEVRTYSVQNLLDAGHSPEDLIASITKCVEPSSWYEDAAISHSGGVLVVRQSQRAHGEIVRLLEDLDRIAEDEEEREADHKQAVVSVKVYQTGKQPADKVARYIEELIAKDTWTAHGGKGKVRVLEGAVVVEQTRDVHQAVENFLRQLAPQAIIPNSPPGAGHAGADPFRVLKPRGENRPAEGPAT